MLNDTIRYHHADSAHLAQMQPDLRLNIELIQLADWISIALTGYGPYRPVELPELRAALRSGPEVIARCTDEMLLASRDAMLEAGAAASILGV